MVVSLRVVLDLLGDTTGSSVAEAEREIARALVRTAPRGCEVSAVVPSGDETSVATAVAGLARVTKAPLARGPLLAAWQIGIAPGIGGGLIHAPSLAAPLVKHDRVNENDQTVVTLWDLCAWETPEGMSRAAVASQRALLKRAERYADAVIVPTHAMAERLAAFSKLSNRVRVISGAAPEGYAVPSDAVGRRRSLGAPEGAVVIAGAYCNDEALASGLSAVASLGGEVPVVVLDISDARAPRVQELASAAGIAASRVRTLGGLEAADRAAVLDGALALLDPSLLAAFPWRVVEALTLGVPVVAAASDVHAEILLDAGLHVASSDLGDALRRVVDSEEARKRFGVRALDRGKAFSWRDHADRVWALHAEL